MARWSFSDPGRLGIRVEEMCEVQGSKCGEEFVIEEENFVAYQMCLKSTTFTAVFIPAIRVINAILSILPNSKTLYCHKMSLFSQVNYEFNIRKSRKQDYIVLLCILD